MPKTRPSMLAAALLLSLLFAPAAAARQPLNFTLPAVDGGYLKLSDFRGRVVLLDFFATWCGPCRGAMAKLDKIHRTYGGQGVSVIGFSLDEGGRRKVRPFVARSGVAFPVVLGNARLAERLAGVQYLPTTLVLDPSGRVVDRIVGAVSAQRLMSKVRPYLNSNAAPPPRSSLVKRRQEGQRRFRRVWVRGEQVLSGRRGVYVHVVADLADLAAEQGLWLALNIQPEARSGGGLVPVAGPKRLYQRVDDSSRLHHILFVSCDQLPQAPLGGVYRSWVTILGPNQKPVEKSGEFIIDQQGCLAAKAQ